MASVALIAHRSRRGHQQKQYWMVESSGGMVRDQYCPLSTEFGPLLQLPMVGPHRSPTVTDVLCYVSILAVSAPKYQINALYWFGVHKISILLLLWWPVGEWIWIWAVQMNKHFSIVTWQKYHKNKIREEWKLLNAICNVKVLCWDTETHMYLKLTCRHVDIWSRLFSVNDPLIFCGGFLPNIWVGILREEQLVMFSKIYTSNIPCLTLTPKHQNMYHYFQELYDN